MHYTNFNWVCSACSTGTMVIRNLTEYMCINCGAVYDKKFVDKKIEEANKWLIKERSKRTSCQI